MWSAVVHVYYARCPLSSGDSSNLFQMSQIHFPRQLHVRKPARGFHKFIYPNEFCPLDIGVENYFRSSTEVLIFYFSSFIFFSTDLCPRYSRLSGRQNEEYSRVNIKHDDHWDEEGAEGTINDLKAQNWHALIKPNWTEIIEIYVGFVVVIYAVSHVSFSAFLIIPEKRGEREIKLLINSLWQCF